MRQFKGKNVEQLWKENARHPQANAPVYSLGHVSTASTHNLLLLLLFKTDNIFNRSVLAQRLLKGCAHPAPASGIYSDNESHTILHCAAQKTTHMFFL